MVLLPGRLTAGDQARDRVVPLPDDEATLGVGHQRVREPPPRAELVVEGLPVGRSSLGDEVAVDQRQTQEELGLERQRRRGGRAAGDGRRPAGVGQRLLVPTLPAESHEQRRERPHRQRRVVLLLGHGQRPAGGRLACPGVARVGEGPALVGEHRHLLEGPERGRAREARLGQRDDLGGAVLEGEPTEERDAQRDIHVGGVLTGEHGVGPVGRLGDPARRAAAHARPPRTRRRRPDDRPAATPRRGGRARPRPSATVPLPRGRRRATTRPPARHRARLPAPAGSPRRADPHPPPSGRVPPRGAGRDGPGRGRAGRWRRGRVGAGRRPCRRPRRAAGRRTPRRALVRPRSAIGGRRPPRRGATRHRRGRRSPGAGRACPARGAAVGEPPVRSTTPAARRSSLPRRLRPR